MAKQLEIQMNDVVRALGDLNICLKLALHDKEQFLKEYGSSLYNVLINIQKETNANEIKVNEKLNKILF
ncbi:hypothetical protein SJC03_140 [Bacteroides phage SJC03]|nr:hypothetical protein SJC03_140 [Bacteroides phage SJC03]